MRVHKPTTDADQFIDGSRPVWELRKHDWTVACELHKSERAAESFELRLVDRNRTPVLTHWCATDREAEFLAASYRREYMREGWAAQIEVEIRSSPPLRSEMSGRRFPRSGG